MSRYACALCFGVDEEPDARTGLCAACLRAALEDNAEGYTLRRCAERASPLTVMGRACLAAAPPRDQQGAVEGPVARRQL